MHRQLWALVVTSIVLASALPGCGDNSLVCGPGTTDDGTGTCAVAPGACQDGTVLVGDACVDPARGLHVDLEEASEPNGLGVATGVELSDVDAGTIAITQRDKPYVVHGHITPFRDDDGDGQLDPDYDTYLITADGPMLLDISVDGVGGLDGALFAVGNSFGVARWERYAIPLVGDTAKRPVLIPGAGTFYLVVGDARSMTIGRHPPMDGQAAAVGSAATEYYMSITWKEMPQATPLTTTDRVATTSGELGSDDIAVFSTPMGTGFNRVAMTTGTSLANPAIVVLASDQFRAQTTNDPTTGASAETLLAGFDTGDSAIIVVDRSYDLASAPAHYDLTITTGDAQPLSTTGGAVSEPVLTTSGADGFELANVFYFDVTTENEIDGLELSWSQPVDAVLVDQDRFVAALFTFDSTLLAPVGHTFTQYKGALRLFAPGRYYLAAYPTTGAVGDTLTATSKIETLAAPQLIELGTPVEDGSTSPFGVHLYRSVSTELWQQFDIAGAGTGDRTAFFMDTSFAYGSLVPIVIDGGLGKTQPDGAVLFEHTYGTPSVPAGHIALDDDGDYLVSVQTATGAGTLTLDFEKRAFVDLGISAAGATKTDSSQLTAATPSRLYLIQTDPGNTVTISQTAPGVVVDVLSYDEAIEQSGATPQLRGVNQLGRVAFRVRATSTPSAPIPYTVSVEAKLGFYAAHVGTTAFADICSPATQLVLGPLPDDGVSSPINAPAGFSFYGVPVSQLVVASDGWLSFDPAVTGPLPFPEALPDGLGRVSIAPMWEDLFGVTACAKLDGTRLIVQWTGKDFVGLTGQFQAILDGSTSSIELVYGPATFTGTDGVVGVQNLTDEESLELTAFVPIITPNSSIVLTHD